jgi:hypothetical protein
MKQQKFCLDPGIIKWFDDLKVAFFTAPTFGLPGLFKDISCHNRWQQDCSSLYIIIVSRRYWKTHHLCLQAGEPRQTEINFKWVRALSSSLGHFWCYFYSHQFIAQMDQLSLACLKKFSDNNSRVMRWVLQLSEFDFTVEYQPRKPTQHADTLSHHTSVVAAEPHLLPPWCPCWILEKCQIAILMKTKAICNSNLKKADPTDKSYSVALSMLFSKVTVF